MGKNYDTYQLVVELSYFKPRMWRRLLIDSNLPLAELGYAIIAMFRAQASHLFHFWHPGKYDLYYECACFESADSWGFGSTHIRSVDARDVTIAKIFPKVGSTLNFEYDFGDSWDFKIKLEKIINEPRSLEVIGGAGYGIIEDCGGVCGLEDIVKLCQTRQGREYEEFVAWTGLVEFDIKNFDHISLNKTLRNEVVEIKEAYEANEH